MLQTLRNSVCYLKPKCCITIVLLLIFTFANVGAVTFHSDSLGVSVGDWMKYVVVKSGQGTAWVYFHDWVRVEVLNVSADSILILETLHYPDGDIYNHTLSISLTSYPGSILPYIHRANLTVGDEVLDEHYYEHLFNSTIYISQIASRTYGEESRNACLAELSYSQLYYEYILDVRAEYWWDRETGFLLEETFETTVQGYGNASKSTQSLIVAETSLWETRAPLNPILPLAILGFSSAIIVGVAGVALKRDKLKARFRK